MKRSDIVKGLVSVVMPIYNGERYIGDTLRAVLNQTYDNLEIICIIDGTKDRSADIIRSFGDDRIRLFEHPNQGATATRNRGLAMARGEYVQFVDQDDVLHPDYLEATIREMNRTGSTAVAVNGRVIDSEGRTIRRMYRVNKPKLTLDRLLQGNQMYTSSQVLMKREALLKIGEFDVLADQADDWDMWIRHAMHGKIVFLDRELLSYRRHDSNQSHNHDKMLRSELHIVERKLPAERQPKVFKSYSYMRYSRRTANWSALVEALRLNGSLLLRPRFYLTACLVAWKNIRH